MAMAQAIDAKSLYDALLADAPNISDRRSLVSVRSVQEVMRPDQVHWIPTNYEFADGLTKVDEKLMYMFRAWLESPMAVLVEHPENASILARLEDSVAKKKKTSEKIVQAIASMLTTLPFRPHV